MTEATIVELATALGVTPRWVQRRAVQESWPSNGETKARARRYAIESLPRDVQAAYFKCYGGADDTEATEYDAESLWSWAATRPQHLQDQGAARAQLLRQVFALADEGVSMADAFREVSERANVPPETLRNWYYGANGKRGARHFARQDWAAALIPAYGARHDQVVACSVGAWEQFKALYLVLNGPSLTVCYRRVARTAEAEGWQWPSLATIRRRVHRDIPRDQRILRREGADAAKRTRPFQDRDRSIFHALEAVNGDGVKFKVQCLWPDGQVMRPVVWCWQDLYSGKHLAWRIDMSENQDMLRLAFGDMVERYGIPDKVWIDNTRAAANKGTTGGVPSRYRFKVKAEDPIGIMPLMGCEVRWTTPGHGQAKPIERSFRDLRDLVDKHPRFQGRGTEAKPIPIDEFERVLDEEMALFNAQTGRRSAVCNGRSFDATFAESYATSAIRKATSAQRRLWLLSSQTVTARKPDGHIVLGRRRGKTGGENRYWSEALSQHMGSKVVARFDPARLHQPVHIYGLDGRYIGAAEPTSTAGFDTRGDERTYYRLQKQADRARKTAADAQTRMTALEAAELIPSHTPTDTPPSQIVRGQFRSQVTVATEAQYEDEDEAASMEREQRFGTRLRIMRDSEPPLE